MSFHPLDKNFATLGDYIIRASRTGECERISQQLSQMDPWRTLEYSPIKLKNYLLSTDPCLRCRVIIANIVNESNIEQIVGVFCVRFPWLFGACLELFAIFPDYQGMGFGAKTLAWLEKCVAADTRNLWILVSAFNESAKIFYDHQGYTVIAKIDNLIQVGFDEILLRKNLTLAKSSSGN
ncbi:N-acetyltransferase domain-containing protein [Gammaproteobacteria bacterium]